MGISRTEFIAAMDTYGAKRLPNTTGTRFNISVPCFKVRGVVFVHSGSYYIVNRGRDRSDIFDKAKEEVGEKNPNIHNFWYDEIHSVKGLIAVSLMLDDNYTKEKLEELVSKTYKKLFNVPSNKSNIVFHAFREENPPKVQQLYDALAEYSRVLNPFGSDSKIKLKNPCEYLDIIKFNMHENIEFYDRLWFYYCVNDCKVMFKVDKKSFAYRACVKIIKNNKKANLEVRHYYDLKDKNDESSLDEVVRVEYISDGYGTYNNNCDISISLKDLKAWDGSKEIPLSDANIDIVIKHVKLATKKIKKDVLSKIQASDSKQNYVLIQQRFMAAVFYV